MPAGTETLDYIDESASAAGNPAKSPSIGRWEAVYGAAIFLGAFLLFQVELILGKRVLPLFGGTPAVWTACLLVFQLLLLAGYSYARFFALTLRAKYQGLAHLVALGSSLVLLVFLAFLWPTPITPSSSWRPLGTDNPTWFIVRFLLAGIGLPFLILATTGPLLQHWFAQKQPGRSPYRLYSLSNLGSLLGLLTYPFLLEPFLRLHMQAWIWTVLYTVFLGLCGSCALKVYRFEEETRASIGAPLTTEKTASPNISSYLLWAGLAACASVLLLATTNMICQQVAVIPFLWVLPLSLYLISFILCFDGERWYRPNLFQGLFIVMACISCTFPIRTSIAGYIEVLVLYSGLLFAGCMVCHGELARLKPEANHLTAFYLSLSFGGALGGIFVGVVAPRIFSDYWELQVGLVGCCVLLVVTAVKDRESWWNRGARWMVFASLTILLLILPLSFKGFNLPWISFPDVNRYAAAGVAAAATIVVFLTGRSRKIESGEIVWVRAAALAALVSIALGWVVPLTHGNQNIAQRRNFFGVLRVQEIQPNNLLRLVHGQTVHGYQSLDPEFRNRPLSYYGLNSGVGILMRNLPDGPHRTGVIGLGTGSMAAYGRAGDYYRFYEINAAEIPWSVAGGHVYFTYIRDSAAKVEVLLGDGRLSMETEAARGEFQHFDVLVLDAFSGDAIPTHLLTREAFEIYLQHLNGPRSVIAVHITNKVLNLAPVLGGLARSLGLHGIHIYRPWRPEASASSDWVLLSRDPTVFSIPEIAQAFAPLSEDDSLPLWTDDYSNLLRVVR
jgi:hypothetical protein